MNWKSVRNSYLLITLLNTLSYSLIWGINTLFQLDGGLSNTEAFAANAFFTAGMVLFEIPTGVIADTWGRRTSYLFGCSTLFFSSIGYLLLWYFKAPFWLWATVSIFIGLGFTFFSGAVDAWLVDALKAKNFDGHLEDIFAKGQTVNGIAMLIGTSMGGIIAQYSNLGVPYVIRAGMIAITFFTALIVMKEYGFKRRKISNFKLEINTILKNSVDLGLKNRSVRWAMLTSPFLFGGGIFGFYAAQPYLLELYGDKSAYGIAGLVGTLFAGTQALGGVIFPKIRKFFSKRSSVLIFTNIAGCLFILLAGVTESFSIALFAFLFWGLSAAISNPAKRAYLNDCIPSDQRATVLSFDGLVGSVGGAVFQPTLGRAADAYSYSLSLILTSAVQAIAIPFALLIRSEKHPSDQIKN